MDLPEPIISRESPREVIAEVFTSLNGGLPISGGWGYTKEDACVINKKDPLVNPREPFNGVAVEYVFVEKRIYAEMIIYRPKGDGFSGIGWKLLKQELKHDKRKSFDKLLFEITAFRDADWEELKAEYEGPDGAKSGHFDKDAHNKKREEKMVIFTREFWFDITSFFGKSNHLFINDKPVKL